MEGGGERSTGEHHHSRGVAQSVPYRTQQDKTHMHTETHAHPHTTRMRGRDIHTQGRGREIHSHTHKHTYTQTLTLFALFFKAMTTTKLLSHANTQLALKHHSGFLREITYPNKQKHLDPTRATHSINPPTRYPCYGTTKPHHSQICQASPPSTLTAAC